MRYTPHDYPTGTMINCVMVGGDGHGKSYLRSPMDAHGFKMMKRPALQPRIFSDSDPEPLMIDAETVYYEPFAEMWNRQGFIRLFAVRTSYTVESESFLLIADAMRIAGVTHL